MSRFLLLVFGLSLLFAVVMAYVFQGQSEARFITGWTTAALKSNRDVPTDIGFHILVTSGRTISILAPGLALAAVLAFVMYRTGSGFLVNVMIMLSAIPPLVWIPLSLAAFGLQEWAFNVPAVLFMGALLAPVILAHAVNAPEATLDILHVLGASDGKIVRSVIVPNIVVGIAPLVAMAFGLVFGISVVVEYLGGFNGVGRVLKVIAGYYEIREIALLTIAVTMLVWLVQALLRSMLLSAARML